MKIKEFQPLALNACSAVQFRLDVEAIYNYRCLHTIVKTFEGGTLAPKDRTCLWHFDLCAIINLRQGLRKLAVGYLLTFIMGISMKMGHNYVM